MKLIMRRFRKASYNFILNYLFYTKDLWQFLPIFIRLHVFYKKRFTLFLFTIYKKMSNLSIKERNIKFNRLSNDLNIKLIKGTKNSILYMKDRVNNGENLTIKPVDLSLKTKEIAFCSELPFGILSFLSMYKLKQPLLFLLM